ncbi:MAG: amidohydrolase family protein [Acidobacteriota bacterium]
MIAFGHTGSAQTPPATPDPIKTLALRHATVVDISRNQLRTDVTLLIRGAAITAMGEKLEPPADATVIDVTGKFLIPGLWDMHVHLSGLERSFRLLLANGVTGVRDMYSGVAPRDYTPWRRNPIAPRLVVAGLIDGPLMERGPGRIPVATPDEAREAVKLLVASGAEFIKVYNSIPREAYFALADEARRIGIPFVGHVPEAISPAEAAMVGQLSQEHLINIMLACSTNEDDLRAQRIALLSDPTLTAAERARRLGFPNPVGLFDTYDEKKASALFGTFADYGIWQTPTLAMYHGFAEPKGATLTTEAVRDLSPEGLRALSDRAGKLLERYKQLVGDMHRAGVPMLAGTDAGPGTGLPLGESLHDELELMVASGFTPAEALATATRNPAFYFGTLTLMGTLDIGRVADIVILDANPLQDIRNTRKIRGVVERGTYYSREALDRLLAEAK